MSRVTRDLVKEELCALLDEVMEAKGVEVCYVLFLICCIFDFVFLSGIRWSCGHKSC